MPADLPPTDRRTDDVTDGSVAIVVYRRAGCGFCASLRRQLRRAGVATVERDIWADPDAAAFVRRHAGGNETVPTVDVAGTVLVNPTARRVKDAALAAGIEIPEPPARWWQRR
jgi:mycoredoxin